MNVFYFIHPVSSTLFSDPSFKALVLSRSKMTLCILFVQQELLYSGSHNTVAVWDTMGQFALKRKLDHEFGSVYSLLITKQYIIIGRLVMHFLHRFKKEILDENL